MDTITSGCLIVGGSLAIALGGMWLVRTRVASDVLLANHEVAGYMLSIVGTLYAILLGLIVVNVQSKFEVANQMAVTEANCLSDIAHLANLYSPTTRKEIHRHLFDYANAARDQDWSKVSTGQSKEETIPFYRALWKSITKIELSGPKQESSYSNLLSTMSQLSDARRFRMVASHNGLSPILWAVLIIGEVLIVWFTYFFFVENIKAQTIMTSFVVVFLSLNLLLVFLYDNPYRSELGARNAGVTFHPEWFLEDDDPKAKSEGGKDSAAGAKDAEEEQKTSATTDKTNTKSENKSN
ncbi:MAG TPA: hypothetical protein V6C76_04650 [Drouetiella sp.]